MKRLTLQLLKREAQNFSEELSNMSIPELYGITDGNRLYYHIQCSTIEIAVQSDYRSGNYRRDSRSRTTFQLPLDAAIMDDEANSGLDSSWK